MGKKKETTNAAIADLSETLAASRSRVESTSEAALEMVAMVEGRKTAEQQEQADREQRIAQTHEFVGRIQGMTFIQKVTTVGTLVQLKQIKEAKTYRDLPNLGTWEKFCEYIGVSRQKVDEDLANLSTFGEDFLTTVSSFSLGYRELRKLRQLTSDGTVSIDEAEIVINGEHIPFTPDHKDDLQNALECVLETSAKLLADKEATIKAKDKVLKSKSELIERQAKELSQLEDSAAAAEMTAPEEAWLRKMDALRISFDGYMLKVDPERCELADPASERTPRMVAAYLTTLDYMRKQLLVAHDVATDLYGSVAMIPEDGWKQPEE